MRRHIQSEGLGALCSNRQQRPHRGQNTKKEQDQSRQNIHTGAEHNQKESSTSQ